jgi:DNA-binding NtrC family response regulator
MYRQGVSTSILVVEDDAPIGHVLVALLEQRGHQASLVASAEEAMHALAHNAFDLVLSDVRLPLMSGLSLLDYVKSNIEELPVILITAHGSVALAVDAMKRGATDFVQKPFDKDEIAFVIEKALAASDRARLAPPTHHRSPTLLGASEAMNAVHALIRKVAKSTITVLVRGETGTGKELVARAIHEQSARNQEAFVVVNCAALADNLLESDLFGHEKGAFTGAAHRKPGRIELAHKGTLFLDEVGELPLAVQAKLLRFLQEREFSRVGGTDVVRVDVRVVSATHRSLEAMVAAGTFREDLFYRLAVVTIAIAPLRDRPLDIALLVRHFVAKFNTRSVMQIDEDAVQRCTEHTWPGNVRELQNVIERLSVLADGHRITRADVERELPHETDAALHGFDGSLEGRRKETERETLLAALSRAENNRTLAARLLKVSRRTLYNKLTEHGLA